MLTSHAGPRDNAVALLKVMPNVRVLTLGCSLAFLEAKSSMTHLDRVSVVG